MIIARYTKTPIERRRQTIDYTEWLDPGELIAGVTFEVMPSAVSVNTITILSPATRIRFFVEGGVSGASYELTAVITTTKGQVKRDKILVLVRGFGVVVVVGPDPTPSALQVVNNGVPVTDNGIEVISS